MLIQNELDRLEVRTADKEERRIEDKTWRIEIEEQRGSWAGQREQRQQELAIIPRPCAENERDF